MPVQCRAAVTNLRCSLSSSHCPLTLAGLVGREIRAEIAELGADVKAQIADITKQMAVQFRYTLLMQMGVLLAVISIMAARG